MSRTGIRHRPVRGEGVAPPNGMTGNRAKGRPSARMTQERPARHVLSRTKEQRARGIAMRHAGRPGLHRRVSVRRGRSVTGLLTRLPAGSAFYDAEAQVTGSLRPMPLPSPANLPGPLRPGARNADGA